MVVLAGWCLLPYVEKGLANVVLFLFAERVTYHETLLFQLSVPFMLMFGLINGVVILVGRSRQIANFSQPVNNAAAATQSGQTTPAGSANHLDLPPSYGASSEEMDG